jgi:hypothetical protein
MEMQKVPQAGFQIKGLDCFVKENNFAKHDVSIKISR